MNLSISPIISNYNLVSRTVSDVSFTGSRQPAQKVYLKDCFEKSYENRAEKRLVAIKETYFDTLESIANTFKEEGVSFDRSECDKFAIKSAKSYTSKIIRSGDVDVRDQVRATLYVNNPYDLTILTEKIIPEMQKRRYDIFREKKTPPLDLDIRLDYDKITENCDLYDVAPEIQKCISKPQKSGYEDIQIRFVRSYDKKKPPLKLELLIVFGPNYEEAKHVESDKVFSVIRRFDKLHTEYKANVNSKARYVSSNIDANKTLINTEISNKLFFNAKLKDTTSNKVELPISVSKEDIESINANFAELKNNIGEYYKERRIKLDYGLFYPYELAAIESTDEGEILIEKIKNNLADDIKITSDVLWDEINKVAEGKLLVAKIRKQMYNKTLKNQREDIKLLDNIHQDLLKTIEYFNSYKKEAIAQSK